MIVPTSKILSPPTRDITYTTTTTATATIPSAELLDKHISTEAIVDSFADETETTEEQTEMTEEQRNKVESDELIAKDIALTQHNRLMKKIDVDNAKECSL